MRALCIDFETCSAADVREVGAWAYSRHPSTRVHCMAYAFTDAPDAVQVWQPCQPVPFVLATHLRSGAPVVAHNSGFERSVIANTLAGVLPNPPLEAWHDTAALAAAVNLPISLEGLASVFSGTPQKDMEGNAIMRQYSHVETWPDGSYQYPNIPEADFRRICEYCALDVRATAALFARLPPLTPTERLLWLLDQAVNLRGVAIDFRRAESMERLAAVRAAALNAEIEAATAGAVASTTAVAAIRDWLVSEGVTLPKALRTRKDGSKTMSVTANAETLRRLVADAKTSERVRAVLSLRLEAGKLTSLAKLRRLPALVDPADARLRYALHYCGSVTGRWSSRGLQLHNLPRDRLGANRPIFEALLEEENAEVMDLLAPAEGMLSVLSQLLRSVVVARDGCELLAGDFSAIEARVLAWLAGQRDVLDLFGSGQDVYVYDAAQIGSDDRQLGKVARLGLGYGMGAVKFAVTALGYGIVLPLREARRVQLAWRRANPAIVDFWHALEDGFRSAMAHRGQTFTVGRVALRCGRSCLRIVLPSGRAIHYWRPHTRRVTKRIDTVDDAGNKVVREFEVEALRFFAADGKVMAPDETYAGKLAEHVTQAVARDLLGEALLRLESAGYPVVMHVHDAAAVEIAAGTGDVDEFCRTMARPPAWADGLPLRVEGYRAARFQK